MRVLLTGATGFLGKYAIEELISHGYEVIAQGRNQKRLEEIKNEYNIEILCVDLSEIANADIECDYVIHAAALSTVWGKWDDFYNSNVVGTSNVIEFCLNKKVKKMIYISSPSIYTSKEDRLDILEDSFDKNNKLSFYIRTKIMAEDIVNLSVQKRGLPAVIIRPRGLFGIGDTSIIPRLIKANRSIGIPLFNGGQNKVDITCVENVALSLRLAIESDCDIGKTYNITNGEPMEFKTILEMLFDRIGEKPNYRKMPLGFMYFVAGILEGIYKLFGIYKEPSLTKYTVLTLGYSQTLNIEKARKDLNYKPLMTIEEGIVKYAESVRQSDNQC